MTIEFHCPDCTALLRTAPDKGGDLIHCPVCNCQLVVPVGGVTEPATFRESFEDQLSMRMSSLNDRRGGSVASPPVPLQRGELLHSNCPKCDFVYDSGYDTCPRCLAEGWLSAPTGKQNRTPRLGSILNESWNLFMQNFGFCMMAGFVNLVLWAFAFIVTTAIAFSAMLSLQGQPELAGLAFLTVELIGLSVIYSRLMAGNVRCFLLLCRGETPSLKSILMLERGTQRIGAAGLIYFSLVAAGLMLGIIPGLLIMIRLWPYSRLVVDRKLATFSSFAKSFELTEGKFLLSLGVFSAHFLVILAANTVPVVGPMLVFPFASILYSVAYLSISESVTTR